MTRPNTIFKRHLLPFTAPVGNLNINHGHCNVFITVELSTKTVDGTAHYTNGNPVPKGTVFTELSITGVEGPKANGDAVGGCGQIDMHMDEAYLNTIKLAEGWTMPMVEQLLEVWKNYHLNDMKAGCDHWAEQGFDPSEKLTIYTMGKTRQYYNLSGDINKRVDKALETEGTVTLTEDERFLRGLPYDLVVPDPEAIAERLKPFYEVKRSESQGAGWVRPQVHDRGLLGRECKVCGLKYGSAWYLKELPEDVLVFLKSLPESPVSLPGQWRR